MKPDAPSATALRIALDRVGASLDPQLRTLLSHPEEPYCEWFVEEHSEEARRQMELWKSGRDNPLIKVLRQALSRGAHLFILLRKRWIEREARRALEAGATQMVVLGAGYDPLCLRLLPEHTDVSFFELDHPSTQAVKRRALEKRNALPGRLALAPADLSSESSEKALLAAGFDPGRRSLFIAEGLLMYLEEPRVDAVFEVARLAARGSTFISTLLDSAAVGRPGAERLMRALAAAGEHVRSTVDMQALDAFLGARGFRTVSVADAEVLRREFLQGREAQLDEGSHIVCAELTAPRDR
jgi:methyltransferase (TIGR00027 family)